VTTDSCVRSNTDLQCSPVNGDVMTVSPANAVHVRLVSVARQPHHCDVSERNSERRKSRRGHRRGYQARYPSRDVVEMEESISA
jgi:hypothetical protein